MGLRRSAPATAAVDMERPAGGLVMTDKGLAAQWDSDHRLAATTAFISGSVVAVGTAVLFSVGMRPIEAIVQGGTATPFGINLVAGLLLVIDIGLLVFVVGLAHAVTAGRSFGLALTTAVATLACAASATIHLVWAYAASSLEVGLPAETVQFATWIAANVWLLPLFGLLVGATLLALAAALRGSGFRFARRLATASAMVGGALCLIAPFSGTGPGQSALVAVTAILLATGGISVLLAVALVKLGLLLWQRARPEPATT